VDVRRAKHFIVACVVLAIGCRLFSCAVACAAEPLSAEADPSTPKLKAEDYRALLDELAAERKHIDELEQKVRALEASNSKLEQSQTALQTDTSQTEKQVVQIQKTLGQQLGPFQFGDRVNSFLGQHTFSLVGSVATGFNYSHLAGRNDYTLDFELNPIIRINDWINFYGSIDTEVASNGVEDISPSLANLEIFPFGWDVPVEVIAGLFDEPFGDYFETQAVNWINPFITLPLVYGSEAFVPASGLGVQVRGGIQWGRAGQDVDYTLWSDSGPTFESARGFGAIPKPVIGELVNPLTGLNLASNSKGFGARFRFYPIPVEAKWGRLELMATTYDGHWQGSHGYESWGAGYVYRVGPFRSRGEWAQSYRAMPNLSPAAQYPGCCGHDNRQGWFVQVGYELYGIPHPDLGDYFERRFDKGELQVRYSGVNQRAIVAEDISDLAAPDSSGSPAIFEPHAREVAFAFDYWFAPSVVWKLETDLELPRAGGQLYSFGTASVPTLHPIGNTSNDVAVLTQIAVGF
jgi:hypothetical protein